MDKMEASVLGIGIFAVAKLFNNVINQDNNSGIGSMMREEAAEIENLSNQVSGGNSQTMEPGIPLSEFVSNKYKISFKYPSSWTVNPRYEDKYEGKSGFFEVGDFDGQGDNIDAAVESQIKEDYKPYGSNPTVRRFIVDGQPARVIYPSADQPDFFIDREAAIVVQYPKDTVINGKDYDYVVIWTSRDYVPLIVSTLKFVK